MGRASRKKNRLRGVSGGVYSKLWTHDSNVHGAMTEIINGKSIYIDDKNIKTIEELFMFYLKDITRKHIPNFTKNGTIDIPEEDSRLTHYYFNKLITEYLRKTGKYHNIFISDENVVNFIENQTIKGTDLKFIPSIMNEYFPSYIDNLFSKMTNEYYEDIFYAASIHLLNRKYSLFFILLKVTNNENVMFISGSDNDNGTIEGGKFPFIEENYNNLDKFTNRCIKIICNTHLYIDAFPDAIKTGPPPVKHLDYVNSLSNTTISETDAIKGLFDSHHVSPHMRRGHYRFLRSDRYKSKRFQTVFVRPTMVKGTADHIIEVRF